MGKLVGTARYKTYKYEVNGFLEAPRSISIDKLISNGFKPWENNGLYIHTIDLDKNRDRINYISITSHPEQQEYMGKHWNKWYKGHKHLNNTDFFKAKTVLKELMAKDTGIPSEMTLDEFKEISKDRNWYDFDKFVDINIKYGSKKQYASYIPHVQVSVNRGLIVERITNVNSDIMYHASPTKDLNYIIPQDSNLDKKKVIFGSKNSSYVKIFCRDWNDSLLSVRTVDYDTFVTEVIPGAIDNIYKNKSGYVYRISADKNNFIQNDNIQGQEYISYKKAKVIEQVVIKDVLSALEDDDTIHLIRI